MYCFWIGHSISNKCIKIKKIQKNVLTFVSAIVIIYDRLEKQIAKKHKCLENIVFSHLFVTMARFYF